MRSIRQIWLSFREWRRSPKGLILTAVLLVLAVGACSFNGVQRKLLEPVDYSQHLDEPVVVVDGSELTLRDLAYYVAHQEMEGQKRGELLDPEHPRTYWNLYVEHGLIMKEATRSAAMQMAIHDEIFYQMAIEEGQTVLSEEEQTALAASEGDFWDDLSDYDGAQRLGITEEDIHSTMERIALAQRFQSIYARMQGGSYEDYEFDKEAYLSLLEKKSYEIQEKLWKRVDFGNVVVQN